MKHFAAAIAFLALNGYLYYFFATTENLPGRTEFEAFPNQVAGWHCDERAEMEPKIIRRLGVTDYLSCIYNDPAERSTIDVYVGYHASQLRDKDNRATNIHPPEHCLPGSGWDIVDSQVVPFRSGNVDGEAKRFVIARGDQRQLVYFWYETQGRVIARNHEVIFYKFWDRARRGRSDSALVRLTVPIERNQAEMAEAQIHAFARDFTPQLASYVPR